MRMEPFEMLREPEHVFTCTMLLGGLKTPEMHESPQALTARQSNTTQSNAGKLPDKPGANLFRDMTGTARAIIVARVAGVKRIDDRIERRC